MIVLNRCGKGWLDVYTTSKESNSSRLPGSAAIQQYLRDIQAIPVLTAVEEKQLGQKVALGDPAARDLLISSNLRLVVKVSRHYLGRGVSLEDLIEEGNLGLMRAVETFNYEVSTRFSTYAVYWIKQSMRRAVINQGRLVRLPAYLVSLMAKWHRASAVLTDRLGRLPMDQEVAEALQLTERKAKVVFLALNLSRVIPNSQELNPKMELGLEVVIPDTRDWPVGNQLHEADCLERIFQGIQDLDPLESKWIQYRFGLFGKEPMGLWAAAQKFGFSRERARTLEKQAIGRLTRLARQR
jgi:RNA polymerase primary sigma factor